LPPLPEELAAMEVAFEALSVAVDVELEVKALAAAVDVESALV
jgi:hypothetical protein